MNIKDFLIKIFLFQALDEKQLELIECAASLKTISKNEHLFHEGQPATAFFIIASGTMKIYKLSAEGNEQILHIQKQNDLIAEAIIFDFDTYPAFCQALEDTQLVRFSKTEFLKLLTQFPEICFQIMRAYSKRIRQLVDKIDELSLHDVRSRLANYLIKNCTYIKDQPVCTLTVSKKDLAAMLGTIPETISRTFSLFKKENIIKENKNRIEILNRNKLKAFC